MTSLGRLPLEGFRLLSYSSSQSRPLRLRGLAPAPRLRRVLPRRVVAQSRNGTKLPPCWRRPELFVILLLGNKLHFPITGAFRGYIEMAIEFACNQCQTKLRVGDDAAGRQAKCPKCSALVAVPQPHLGEPALSPLGSMASSPLTSHELPPRRDFAAEINPYASPAPATQPPTSYGPVTPGVLDLGRMLSQTWEIYKVHWGMCIVALLIMWALGFAFNMGTGVVTQVLVQARPPFAAIMTTQAVIFIAQQVFQQWLNLGLILFMLRIVRGNPPDLIDIFRGGQFLLRGVGAMLLLWLMLAGITVVFVGIPAGIAGLLSQNSDAAAIVAIIGGVIAVVPFFYVVLTYSQLFYLIVDRDAGVMDSFRLSQQITRGNKMTLFLVYLVLGIIAMSGVIALCIGILFTLPIMMVGLAVTYLHLVSREGQDIA